MDVSPKEGTMKVLVVYDSQYGNTEKIAQAIGAAFPADTVRVVKVDAAKPADLAGIDLLIVGSPTQGGRGTQSVQKFLSDIPAGALKNVKVAAFDTRFQAKEKGFALRLLMKSVGYATGRIASALEGKGGTPAAEPQAFFVSGREGPLHEGEVERATAWAKTLAGKG